MKGIESMIAIACAAMLVATAGCRTTPVLEQPSGTRGLEREMSERFDLGMPAADVVEVLQSEGWSCRPVIDGEIVMDDPGPDCDYSRAQSLMCQRVRRVIGAERVYQVRIGLRDGLVSSVSAGVERFKPPNPTWGYR